MLAAVAAAYTLASLIAVPLLVERAAARYAARSPEHAAAAARVSFNPLTGTVELLDVVWVEPAAGISLAAPRVTAEIGIASLLERRLALDALTVTEPRVALRWPPRPGAPLGVLSGGSARIDRLELNDGALALAPSATGGADGARPLGRGTLLIEGLDGRAPAGTRYALRFTAATGAEIDLTGELTPPLGLASGRLHTSSLDVAALAPRLDARLAAAAPSGRLAVAGDYVLTAADGGWHLELPAARVELDDLRFAPLPGVAVRAPSVVVDVHALVRHAEGEARTAASARLDRAGFEIEDSRFGASMTFALTDVAGVVALDDPRVPETSGVAIEIDGRLDGGGAASFAARFPSPDRGPTADGRATVALEAADVPATLLAPAASSVLDRGVTAGRVDLAVEYSRELRGAAIDGRVTVAATGLELDGDLDGRWPLGLALSTDAERRTELTAPIGAPALAGAAGAANEAAGAAVAVTASGGPARLDGALAAALAVRTRLEAIAADPFATLAALVGREPFLLRAVEFEPGTAELSPAGVQTVDALAEALDARPLLALAAGGGFDPRADRDALATRQIELHVTLATAGAAPQARPRPVDFASARAQDILDEFARERVPPARLEAIAARFRFDPSWAPDAPARVAYYRALFDALVANETIADGALERLGRFRGRSIAAALAERGVAPDRIEVGETAGTVTAGPQGVAVPLEVRTVPLAPPHSVELAASLL